MKLNDWPLIDLFTRLRGAGLPLGVDDYELLLLAMKGDFGENRESLYRLCCTLWIKSDEDKRIFDIIFDEFISEPLNREIPSIKQPQLWSNAWSRPFHQFNRRLVLGGVLITVWIVLLLIGQMNENPVENPTPIQNISRILEQLQKVQDIISKEQLQPIIPPQSSSPSVPNSPNQLLPTPTPPDPLPKIIFSSASLLQVDKDIEKIKQVNLNKEQTEQQLGINDEMLKKIHNNVIFFKKSGITLKHIEQIGSSAQKEAIKEELSVIFQRINKCAEVLRKLEMTDMSNISKINGQTSGLTLDEIKKLRLTAEQLQKLGLPPNTIDILTNTQKPMEIKTGIRSSAPTERITIGLLLAIAVVARLVTARRMSKSASTPETALPKTTTVPEGAGITPNMADLNDEDLQSGYVLPDMCLPVTRRQMQQSWRHLCRRVREGAAVELDVEATINKMGRQGMLLEFVQVPRRINRAELLLLIDQGGSMVPFHIASRQLVETVLQGGRLGKIDIYYFHNWLDHNIYLYLNSNLQGESITFTEILSYLHTQYTSVMIFSDGGAARGRYNRERISSTHSFLGKLRQRVRHVVWLNPVPRDRWTITTAGEIAKSVPMFEFDRGGLQNAISVLQGKLQYTQPKD